MLAVVVTGSWSAGALSPEPAPAVPVVPAPARPDPPVVPVPSAALTTAEGWARAVVGPRDRDWWLAALRPLTPAEFLSLLVTEADERAAPRGVTGPAVPVSGANGSADVDAPTDRGAVRVQLADVGGTWLVAGADPAGAS